MHALLLLFALLGHAFLWIGLVNRLHALGIRRRIVSATTVVLFLCAALLPVGIGWWIVQGGGVKSPLMSGSSLVGLLISVYLMACWVVAPVTLLRTVYLRVLRRPPSILRFHRRRPTPVNPAAAAISAAETAHHFLARLPGNETLQLTVADYVLDVPRLAPALDGLRIVHLSDLHFTGRVGKAYFREVVRTSNELRPDLAVVTGDLVDTPTCLAWIADTLGRLTARAGVYFILGNHDLRVDTAVLRRKLEEGGLIDVGGRCRQIDIDGVAVMVAGNERPWIGPAADMNACPSAGPDGPLRIALAHTPDQLAWARTHHVDLLLTGHTHGGQICIPPLGPILMPTIRGVKYASGVYYAPPTILHVTRGISGDIPVRWNCPPEIACLKLRAIVPRDGRR